MILPYMQALARLRTHDKLPKRLVSIKDDDTGRGGERERENELTSYLSISYGCSKKSTSITTCIL
jgi:tRNA A37 methylthiotransferase MiaB